MLAVQKHVGSPYDTSQRDYIFAEKLFLVNLEEDPGETTNLAKEFPEKVKELENQYKECLHNSAN